MNEAHARDEICRVGRSLFERGYVHATAGNISVRLDDGSFLITPTDASLGFLQPDRLARVDASMKHVGGDRPSKTLALHAALYAAVRNRDAGTACIIHTHSTHCVALSLRVTGEELLPPLTPYFVMKVGHVPVVPYGTPGSPEAVRQAVGAVERYASRGLALRAVMLARLGPNVWHDSPAQAMAVLEELEETAKLACLSPTMPAPLADAHIEDLRRTFNARW
ncbi:MAG: aldolase [Proteobacteria bacterium]|nr:aldolase [Pseudomonadota bacterium]